MRSLSQWTIGPLSGQKHDVLGSYCSVLMLLLCYLICRGALGHCALAAPTFNTCSHTVAYASVAQSARIDAVPSPHEKKVCPSGNFKTFKTFKVSESDPDPESGFKSSKTFETF